MNIPFANTSRLFIEKHHSGEILGTREMANKRKKITAQVQVRHLGEAKNTNSHLSATAPTVAKSMLTSQPFPFACSIQN